MPQNFLASSTDSDVLRRLFIATLIKEQKNGTIRSIGRLTDPTKKGKKLWHQRCKSIIHSQEKKSPLSH